MGKDHGQLKVLVLPILSTFAVLARFIWRKSSRLKVAADDYVILLGLIMTWALWVSSHLSETRSMVVYGRANPFLTLSFSDQKNLLRWCLAADLIYNMCISSIKLSILLFYLRAFGTTQKIRIITWTIFGVISLWTVIRFLTEFFHCKPVSFYWNKRRPGRCWNLFPFLISMQVFTLATDVIILVFPMPIVWKLRMPTKQKMAICGVFLVGGIACGASIARAVLIKPFLNSDFALHAGSILLASNLEVNLGIMTACAPTIRTSIRRVKWLQSSRSQTSDDQALPSHLHLNTVSLGTVIEYQNEHKDTPPARPNQNRKGSVAEIFSRIEAEGGSLVKVETTDKGTFESPSSIPERDLEAEPPSKSKS